VASGRPVGFVAVALNAFHERMGWIEIIGVDPDYQRRSMSAHPGDRPSEPPSAIGEIAPHARRSGQG
jgi:hypothetical protein